jgi:hypothetical protein
MKQAWLWLPCPGNRNATFMTAHPRSPFCQGSRARGGFGRGGFGPKALAVSRCGRFVRESSRWRASSLTPSSPARQRREEPNKVVDISLGEGDGRNVLVEIGVLQAIARVVVVTHIPKRLLRAVVKLGSRRQPVAQVRCFEGRHIGLSLHDDRAAPAITELKYKPTAARSAADQETV